MKDPKPDRIVIPQEEKKSEVKPAKYELPVERPKPTPNPPKKK